MTMLGKAAVLATAALGLPFVTGDMKPGEHDREIVRVGDKVPSGFCRMIAEISPHEVGKCAGASTGWSVRQQR